MLADGEIIGDGSWNLTIYVTDMDVERIMVVKGDMHIGGVMLKLVDTLGVSKDWSDHALWWPQRNRWLCHTRSTLDQHEVHADAVLHFTPMHKQLRIQMPDLRYIDCRLDFSVKTFSAVVTLCKNLGIRHPEELSLCKPLESRHLKQNYQSLKDVKNTKNGHVADTNNFIRGSSNSLDRARPNCPATPPPPRSYSATPVGQNGTLRRCNGFAADDTSSDGGYCGTPPRAASLDALDSLADIPLEDTPFEIQNGRDTQLMPNSLIERARMNVAWLDSSLSIMEQGVREWDTLKLRFKYYMFYDLTERAHDARRLNQLYQQARWQILNQEVHCTEEEMLVFAALQLQIELQTMSGSSQAEEEPPAAAAEDEIDAALTALQLQLEGGAPSDTDITHVPELAGYLKYFKPRRFTLKGAKRGWVSCRDGVVRVHSTREAAARGDPPSLSVSLRGAEVVPDAAPAHNKYYIKLELPADDAMQELQLRCDNEEQYAEWVAACRLGSRGRSLADAAYGAEKADVLELLALQKPQPGAAVSATQLPHHIHPENYIAPRFYRKLRNKLTQRVLENHGNVRSLPLLKAKLQYIRAWQSLPDYGQTLFAVRFGGSNDELISIANNRIMRLDPHSGDPIKIWRFRTLKAWNVNWKSKYMMVQFEEENIKFSVLSADCKVVHEFIGAYIFLSMRRKDANQTLDEELFHKLTCGWA